MINFLTFWHCFAGQYYCLDIADQLGPWGSLIIEQPCSNFNVRNTCMASQINHAHDAIWQFPDVAGIVSRGKYSPGQLFPRSHNVYRVSAEILLTETAICACARRDSLLLWIIYSVATKSGPDRMVLRPSLGPIDSFPRLSLLAFLLLKGMIYCFR